MPRIKLLFSSAHLNTLINLSGLRLSWEDIAVLMSDLSGSKVSAANLRWHAQHDPPIRKAVELGRAKAAFSISRALYKLSEGWDDIDVRPPSVTAIQYLERSRGIEPADSPVDLPPFPSSNEPMVAIYLPDNGRGDCALPLVPAPDEEDDYWRGEE